MSDSKKSKIMQEITDFAIKWPTKKIEDMKLLSTQAYEQGWYLNEVLIFTLNGSIIANDRLNDAVIELINEDWDEYWNNLVEYRPSRKELFMEIKRCHELSLYGAAIHLSFSQADGLFYDKFGVNLYSNRFGIAKNKFCLELNDFISRDSIEVLSAHYEDGSLLRRIINEVYSDILSKTDGDIVKKTDNIVERELLLPNRHGVLHGIHTDYVSELNSYKAITFLIFILFALNGEEIMK
ncbi:hypothetical protein HQQ94_05910 [Shewanella sp. VB17]|uniref:hypothetical protein n=1 Tax=Shewanella sp. VB17 TaxID=2739432 RepID=UPI001564977B|nr:hypothetical protein [Shewanella sp. VB17]NRD72790.1 hypothetical protein [Shewanella sp. VB17]